VRKVIFQKFEATGLHHHNIVLKRVQSYLTQQCQRVLVGGKLSAPLLVLSGVPQGSVLEFLLFLIYICLLLWYFTLTFLLITWWYIDALIIQRMLNTFSRTMIS